MDTLDEQIITELERKLSISIAKTAQLIQEVIELKESKEEMVEALEEVNEQFKQACEITYPLNHRIKRLVTKAKQS